MNLTLFSVFLPSGVNFFLENKGPGFELFFSSRIGLDPNDGVSSIDADARMSKIRPAP